MTIIMFITIMMIFIVQNMLMMAMMMTNWWEFFGIEVKWCLHFLRVIMLLCTSYGVDDDGDDEIRSIWFAVNLG